MVDAAFVPEIAVRARRRCGEAVLPVPRGPARSMGVQKAAPSATACSRWGLLASDDASVPTAAPDGSGAAREGLDRITLKKNSGPNRGLLASSLSAGRGQG